jgi:hypothetical protein
LKRIHFALLVIGLAWLTVFLCVIGSGVILRETRLGVVARFLDKLPLAIGTSIFALLYYIFLFGWIILIGAALEPLMRRPNGN